MYAHVRLPLPQARTCTFFSLPLLLPESSSFSLFYQGKLKPRHGLELSLPAMETRLYLQGIHAAAPDHSVSRARPPSLRSGELLPRSLDPSIRPSSSSPMTPAWIPRSVSPASSPAFRSTRSVEKAGVSSSMEPTASVVATARSVENGDGRSGRKKNGDGGGLPLSI